MIQPEFELNVRGIATLRRSLPGLLAREVGRELRRIGVEFDGKMAQRFAGTVDAQGRNRGSLPASRTGALQRSLGWQVEAPEGNPDGARLIVFIGGRGIPYAFIQEYGGEVVGRPWLTIPLPDNLTPSGVPRYPSAAALRASGETFIIRSINGTPLIVRRKQSGELEFLWMLVRRVRIPARLGFGDTWRSEDMQRIRDERLRRAFNRALNSATSQANRVR